MVAGQKCDVAGHMLSGCQHLGHADSDNTKREHFAEHASQEQLNLFVFRLSTKIYCPQISISYLVRPFTDIYLIIVSEKFIQKGRSAIDSFVS